MALAVRLVSKTENWCKNKACTFCLLVLICLHSFPSHRKESNNLAGFFNFKPSLCEIFESAHFLLVCFLETSRSMTKFCNNLL